jgi:hypothetical protein
MRHKSQQPSKSPRDGHSDFRSLEGGGHSDFRHLEEAGGRSDFRHPGERWSFGFPPLGGRGGRSDFRRLEGEAVIQFLRPGGDPARTPGPARPVRPARPRRARRWPWPPPWSRTAGGRSPVHPPACPPRPAPAPGTRRGLRRDPGPQVAGRPRTAGRMSAAPTWSTWCGSRPARLAEAARSRSASAALKIAPKIAVPARLDRAAEPHPIRPLRVRDRRQCRGRTPGQDQPGPYSRRRVLPVRADRGHHRGSSLLPTWSRYPTTSTVASTCSTRSRRR